ncbi:unnamed protein product [Calypogeia fissa]
MGWRDSYTTLLELFPQVDARLIRGAALEHGDDVGAAAEFILNDVLGADEGNSDQQPDTITHHGSPSSSLDVQQRTASAEEEQAVTPTDFGTSIEDSKQDEQVVVSVSSSEALRTPESHSGSAVLHITIEPEEAQELIGETSNESRDEILQTAVEKGDRVEPEVADVAAGGSMEPIEDDELGLSDMVRQIFLLSRVKKDGKARTSAISTPPVSANQDSVQKSVKSDGVVKDSIESPSQELIGETSNESRDEILQTEVEMGDRVEPEVADVAAGGSMEPVEDDELGLSHIVRQIFLLSRVKKDSKARTSAISTPPVSANQESVQKSVKSDGVVKDSIEGLADPVDRKVMEEDEIEVKNSRGKSQVALRMFEASTSNTAGEESPAVFEDDGTLEAVYRDIVRADSPINEAEIFQHLLHMEEGKEHTVDLDEADIPEEVLRLVSDEESITRDFTADEFPVYDESISFPRPASHEEDEVAVNDALDSMMSIQKSAISEEMDRADWENVNAISVIQLNQMEPLDTLVEEAKADKEALISSIEEIRVLRLMTDQAEYASRQSREEAARGGLDVMAKVDEMRKMLSRAREANAVHAGEVFGEKAVLATEARELQYRLAQVNSEKAKAVAALNEIKASLQARIESAVQEREAAEKEKVEKELLAKEALVKEEALMAKVAQESRDLDAEAEACTKIREFLIERGSTVDALQGEVAVLREDAESLKKDLESMSLSYSGFHVNMLSRAGSEIYNSVVSQSGKFSDSYGQPSENVVQLESGAIAIINSGSPSLRSASGVQKPTSDRKSWSSLPSLLRGLSGSQDLNGSSHSGYTSNASNSLSASRDALDVNNQVERSQLLGSENSMIDIKYRSSPNSPTSPEEKKQEERELLKAKMAIFPGEELEMEYMVSHNLDVFRTEKPNGLNADTDEEDWQVLEKVSSRSSSRASGDK